MTAGSPDIGKFAAILSEPVPPDVAMLARLRLFDWLIALHGGASTEDGEGATAGLDWLGGNGRVPVIWRDVNAGPVDAALSMARVARSSEIDDLHLSSGMTPGAVAIPAVLAAAGFEPEISAERVLDAVAAGYEAVTRIGSAIGGPSVLFQGIWPSLLAAPIGAAAAAVRALGGGAKELEAAMSAAGELTVLSRPREDHRFLSFGCGVANGVMVAADTMLGRKRPGGGAWSFTRRVPTGFEASALDESDGHWDGMASTCRKPFCAAGQASAAIGLALAKRETIEELDTISGIDVYVPAQVKGMVGGKPDEDRPSRGAVSYGVALALCSPEELWDCRRGKPITDGAVKSLMKKVSVHADDELSRRFPEAWGARVVVAGAGGTTVEWGETEPVLVPATTWEDLLTKARWVARDLPDGSVEALRRLCEGFGQLSELLAGSTGILGEARPPGAV